MGVLGSDKVQTLFTYACHLSLPWHVECLDNFHYKCLNDNPLGRQNYLADLKRGNLL